MEYKTWKKHESAECGPKPPFNNLRRTSVRAPNLCSTSVQPPFAPRTSVQPPFSLCWVVFLIFFVFLIFSENCRKNCKKHKIYNFREKSCFGHNLCHLCRCRKPQRWFNEFCQSTKVGGLTRPHPPHPPNSCFIQIYLKIENATCEQK